MRLFPPSASRLSIALMITILLSACSTAYPNKNILGSKLPAMAGETLEKQRVELPGMFDAPLTLLLVGYKQDSQFDIDRWLIGLDMTKTNVSAYEIPAIQGMFPRMFKPFINNGMRAGIPKELWKGVVTLYKDGDAMQQFTGNQNANNARILLIDDKASVLYFYDRGFSVSALNDVNKLIKRLSK
jgi:hypothetical protein